jgi:hypothetical protein
MKTIEEIKLALQVSRHTRAYYIKCLRNDPFDHPYIRNHPQKLDETIKDWEKCTRDEQIIIEALEWVLNQHNSTDDRNEEGRTSIGAILDTEIENWKKGVR